MRKKLGTKQSDGEKAVKGSRCATCKQYPPEAKIRIVLDGLNSSMLDVMCRD